MLILMTLCNHVFRDVKSSENPFFLTAAMQKSFEMALLAVSQRWPVLLYGTMGAGKSALIKKLAHDYGSRGIICLTKFLP